MKYNMSFDQDARENCLRRIKDYKRFNIYKISNENFAERIVEEISNEKKH